MTENTELLLGEHDDKIAKAQSGIAILPKTDERPLGIVCLDDTLIEDAEKLSKTLEGMGLENIVMTVEDAEKEGITREDLIEAQLKEKLDGNLLDRRQAEGRSNREPKKVKRKKKAKKTHRRK
jgi:hypothetical protein